MKNLVNLNKKLGWVLIIGIALTQVIITKITLDIGRMAPYYAFLIAVIFLPFLITAIASILSRERHQNKIKVGIVIALTFQVGLSLLLPYFFDKEFIYIGFIGILLGGILWCFRNKIEMQLLILNGTGAIIWFLVSLGGLINL